MKIYELIKKDNERKPRRAAQMAELDRLLAEDEERENRRDDIQIRDEDDDR